MRKYEIRAEYRGILCEEDLIKTLEAAGVEDAESLLALPDRELEWELCTEKHARSLGLMLAICATAMKLQVIVTEPDEGLDPDAVAAVAKEEEELNGMD